ncbi:hypothetical protein KY362_00480 [Candidatus Woesearchaeota archaeon]|nr:hypothetical protein [Candidatus Woesearchaeota archaeon]
MTKTIPWITGRPTGNPAELYRNLLESSGFEPELLQSADEAISFCAQQRYQLIVVEPELPPGGRDVHEAIDAVRPVDGSFEYYAGVAKVVIDLIREGPNRDTPIVVLSLFDDWAEVYSRARELMVSSQADRYIEMTGIRDSGEFPDSEKIFKTLLDYARTGRR